MEKSAPNSKPTRAAKLKNLPPAPPNLCVSPVALLPGAARGPGGAAGLQQTQRQPCQCGAAENQLGVGRGWGGGVRGGWGGGCSNSPCSPGDCSPGGGHSAPALFCPIRAKDREASSVPRGLSVPAPCQPQLEGLLEPPQRRETEVFGKSMGILSLPPPPPPHSPILSPAAALRARGFAAAERWPKEQMQGQRQATMASELSAPLPVFHVPHIDPPLKPASRILWWP